MQARRRCILDGVGISVQRILVSILISHNSSRLMAIDAHVGFICGFVCYGLPHLALWLPILSFVCTTLRLARRERNDVHSLTYPPMITQCCIRASLPAGQLQLSALSVSGARPYGANAIRGTRSLPECIMARHAAVPSSVSNVFDLSSIACSIQHSVFRRSSCARASMRLARREWCDVSRSGVGVLHAREAFLTE